MLLLSPLANRVTTTKNLLRAKYTMTNLGPVCCFLGIEIKRYRSRRILHIHQLRTVRKLLATSRVRLGKHKRHSKDTRHRW